MIANQATVTQQGERIRVESANGQVKIGVERYDENLGWYTAGSLTLPLHQLPFVQQALSRAQSSCPQRQPRGKSADNIIFFPTPVEAEKPRS